MTSRFPRLLLLLNWFLALRSLFRILKSRWLAGLRPPAMKEVKEFTEKIENQKNTKKKTLYDIRVFKEYLDACEEKREIIEDITPVELQEKKLKITESDDSCQSQ